MRKHFFGKVVLAVLLAGSLTACANADMVKVKVTNKTDATISIAFARAQTDTGGAEFDPDCSKGWWNIQPGQTKTSIRMDTARSTRSTFTPLPMEESASGAASQKTPLG